MVLGQIADSLIPDKQQRCGAYIVALDQSAAVFDIQVRAYIYVRTYVRT